MQYQNDLCRCDQRAASVLGKSGRPCKEMLTEQINSRHHRIEEMIFLHEILPNHDSGCDNHHEINLFNVCHHHRRHHVLFFADQAAADVACHVIQ